MTGQAKEGVFSMASVILEGYKIRELHIHDNHDDGVEAYQRLESQGEYLHQVIMKSKDDGSCKTRTTVSVKSPEENEPFVVRVAIEGRFSIVGEASEKEIYLLSHEGIFPYIRATVSTLTGLAGLPNLLIPLIHMNDVDITAEEK